ncbi:MAG: VTT domain-containing protein, partial [Bryobacteraceae bacterium]|nr:VTT domain-containing protein [Bryobacteraceae bacterium]
MIEALIDFLRTLTTPERLIKLLATVFTGWLGYALLFGVVFAETGLLTGFFLPGDSFLFTVGVVAGAGRLSLGWVWAVLIAAGILGDSTGYWLGRRTGPVIFGRPDSRFFKREHLVRSQKFYQKYGGRTIVLAKFVPIIRTFAPFLAGVSRMHYPRFLAYSVSGVVGWVVSLTTLGYTLGGVPLVRRHFEKVILAIILLSLIPVLSESLRARR